MRKTFQDPKWLELSASLRQGSLYVKMPMLRAHELLMCLNMASLLRTDAGISPVAELTEFLHSEYQRATNPSLFYAANADDVRKDIEALRAVEPRDRTEPLQQFRETLEAGLRNDPQVDWIRRVGGPEPDNGLEGLKKAEPRQPQDISLQITSF